MDAELQVMRLLRANSFLELSLDLLHLKDADIVRDIIKSNCDKIAIYNKKELNVINPTKRELGGVSRSLKRVVHNAYLSPIKSKLGSAIGFFELSDRYYEHENVGVECNCELCIKEGKAEDDFYINKDKLIEPLNVLEKEIWDKCEKTILPKEILNAKILLIRNNPTSHLYNKIEAELNEFLKIKFLEAFNEQNEEFIKTRILTYQV